MNLKKPTTNSIEKTDLKPIPKPIIGVDRVSFFKKLRVTLFDSFTQLQVDSINAILDEIEAQNVTDKRHMAYIFATAYHEAMNLKTKERIVPVVEFGGDAYLKSKKYYPYVGRGFVQLTWDFNYKKYSEIMGIDFIAKPELLLEIKNSAFIIVHGMIHGVFTGKKLSDYIGVKTDYMNARRIINGTDKANLIASHANAFFTALN